MKFTQSWLTRHLKIKSTSNHISEVLTKIGLEVESITKPNKNLNLFKVAQILNVSKHPNADKLWLLDVNFGGPVKRIVTGLRGIYEHEDLLGKKIITLSRNVFYAAGNH